MVRPDRRRSYLSVAAMISRPQAGWEINEGLLTVENVAVNASKTDVGHRYDNEKKNTNREEREERENVTTTAAKTVNRAFFFLLFSSFFLSLEHQGSFCVGHSYYLFILRSGYVFLRKQARSQGEQALLSSSLSFSLASITTGAWSVILIIWTFSYI